VAQAWVNQCNDVHGMLWDCSGQRLGQNLNRAILGVTNFTELTDAWLKERELFDFTTGACFPGKMCGHYTQAVWARSSEVGCAAAQCNNLRMTLFICNYRRGGNVGGEPVFMPGTPCSNCDSDATGAGYKCVNNLCISCSPTTDDTCKCGKPLNCLNGGVFSTKTCSCVCPKAFYGNVCEFRCDCKDTAAGYNCKSWNGQGLCTSSPSSIKHMRANCWATCAYPCVDLPASCTA